MGFMPGAVSSAFDVPQPLQPRCAPLPYEGWWVPLTATLYPAFLSLRFVQDPVMVMAAVVALYTLRLVAVQRGTTAWPHNQPGPLGGQGA